MNIENVLALANQLEIIGLENAGYLLLKRICFKPDRFCLLKKVVKENEQLSIQFHIERNYKQNIYVLLYYDAVLQKEIKLENSVINGVSTSGLEKRMAAVNWKAAFDFEVTGQCNVADKNSWEPEQRVNLIMEDLSILETIEEGKAIATAFKLKFWTGIPYQELMGNINSIKSKTEVSQRFHFFEGQAGISIDEAYRFLQNRLLEKQFLINRKSTDNSGEAEPVSAGRANQGSGLLQKKNKNKSRATGANKLIRD